MARVGGCSWWRGLCGVHPCHCCGAMHRMLWQAPLLRSLLALLSGPSLQPAALSPRASPPRPLAPLPPALARLPPCSPRGDDLDTRLLRAMVVKGMLEQVRGRRRGQPGAWVGAAGRAAVRRSAGVRRPAGWLAASWPAAHPSNLIHRQITAPSVHLADADLLASQPANAPTQALSSHPTLFRPTPPAPAPPDHHLLGQPGQRRPAGQEARPAHRGDGGAVRRRGRAGRDRGGPGAGCWAWCLRAGARLHSGGRVPLARQLSLSVHSTCASLAGRHRRQEGQPSP